MTTALLITNYMHAHCHLTTANQGATLSPLIAQHQVVLLPSDLVHVQDMLGAGRPLLP